jgi:MFS family permease
MLTRFWQAFTLLQRYPAFARFWIGQLVSLLGDAMTLIALPWFVLQLTGSGTATAAVLLSLQLPAILTGLLMGALIDRFQPRLVMGLDNALRMLIVALIPLLYWLNGLELWLLFVLTTLAGMLQPATLVGSRTILPELVADADLDDANMLWSFSVNLSVIIGPALAGILVATFSGPFVLLLDAATFAVMALVAVSLPTRERTTPPTPAPLMERFGLRQLWEVKVVRLTTLLSLIFFFSYGPLEAAMPLYTADVLQAGARGYGLLWTALGVGALLGTLSSTALSRYVRLGVVLPLIALLWGACLLPMAVIDNLWLACLFFALGGLIWGPYTPLETTLLQRSIPKEQLGPRLRGALHPVDEWRTPGPGRGWGVAGLCFGAHLDCAVWSGLCTGRPGGLASPTLRKLALPTVKAHPNL